MGKEPEEKIAKIIAYRLKLISACGYWLSGPALRGLSQRSE